MEVDRTPKGVISASNSSTSALGGGASFAPTGEDVTRYSSVAVSVIAEPATAVGDLYLEFSSNGTDWDISRKVEVLRPDDGHALVVPVQAKFFRTRYVNGAVVQTAFRLQTALHTDRGAGEVRLSAIDAVGESNPIQQRQGRLLVELGTKTAFGEIKVAELTPVIQLTFPYGKIPVHIRECLAGGGSITTAASKLKASSGSTAGGVALARSRQYLKYRAGQGVEAKFTTLYLTSNTGTQAIVGPIDPEDGYGILRDGPDLKLLHRAHGQMEIRSLTMTTAPTSAGNVTVQLNGGSGVAVALLGTDTIGEACRKIADADYSGEGGGWLTMYAGNKVYFLSCIAESRTGAYSFTDTGVTGAAASIASVVGGSAPTREDLIERANWSEDSADGSGFLPALDEEKGLVWRIQFQYLGFGGAVFALEDPGTEEFVDIHRIAYAGSATVTNLGNPSVPMSMTADNKGQAQNVEVEVASMSASVQGKVELAGAIPESTLTRLGTTGNDEDPIFALLVKPVFGGRTSKARVKLRSLVVGNDAAKPATFRVLVNPTLTGAPAFADIGDGVVQKDEALTGVIADSEERSFIYAIGENDGQSFAINIDLWPGDIVVVLGDNGAGTDDVVAALNWLVDL